MRAPKEPKIKPPNIDAYDGTTNPDMHLLAYMHHMGSAKWFERLPAGTISSFSELELLFSTRFMAHKEEKKTSMHLSRIQQGKDELLRSYVKRFNLEAGQIPDFPDRVAFDNFIREFKKGSFNFDLVKKSVRTMVEVLDEAEAFILATKICSVQKEPRGSDTAEPAEKKEKFEKKSRPNGTWAIAKEPDRVSATAGQKRPRTYDQERFEYNTDLYTILMDVGSKFEIDRPFPMKSPPESRDPTLYCHFHNDIGHDTKECKSLKRALDGLAAKGFLKNYTSKKYWRFGKAVL
ncbi:uncharacterized protein [Spinacia oleracea]|uniref:Retrotransposon gag domain-containing protein n=1 Tax=Spinacia oleracea TaxID=3562 RepID=A0ABM3RHU3_SPIOL|nr:uncharacterized protein LOC130469735 [Spinacia oleracea]